MDVNLFSYDLPEDAVAQEPRPRGSSRMLLANRATGEVADHSFADIPAILEPGDLLVVNDTKVLPARLYGTTVGGGKVEMLIIRRLDDRRCSVLVRPARRLRPGTAITLPGGLTATVESMGERGERTVRFSSDPGEIMRIHGHVPLPPYIRRPDTRKDREWYQTVYARSEGSVAAPTAGLHFSPSILERLLSRGVEVASVTLHVSIGTFRPVNVDDADDHRMDSEWYRIDETSAAMVDRAKREGRRVIAVGTTSVRVLESAARISSESLSAGEGWTDLFITPGFSFRVVDGLLTNFHLPRSSLLMLVSAFAGREPVLRWYRYALEAGYRFYSYGDCMLIL